MTEQNASIIELKCHPVMWYFMMVFYLFVSFMSIGWPFYCIYEELPTEPIHFTMRSFIANSSLFGLFILFVMASIFLFLYLFLRSLHGLITCPRRILIDDSAICIFMPFFTWRIPVDEILRIKVKKYRIKDVFITIIRKKAFINLPIEFDWNFQSTDYETVLVELVKRFGGEYEGHKFERMTGSRS